MLHLARSPAEQSLAARGDSPSFTSSEHPGAEHQISEAQEERGCKDTMPCLKHITLPKNQAKPPILGST